MMKMKKIMTFLILAMFLIAKVPLFKVSAADMGGMDVFPEADFLLTQDRDYWDEDTVKTKVSLDNEDIYQLNLEFQNDNGTKVVIYHTKVGGEFVGERAVETFVEGGTYRLTRVFGRLLPSAPYSFTAEQLGKELVFYVIMENAAPKTSIEFSTETITEGEDLSVKIQLPFKPYHIDEIEGHWEFLDKQDGDSDYYGLMFMNNFGMKYNEANGMYEANIRISNRPEGRYQLNTLIVKSGMTGERYEYFRDDSNVDFNADYTLKAKTTLDFNISALEETYTHGDTVKFEFALDSIVAADDALIKYRAKDEGNETSFEYRIRRSEDNVLRKDIIISDDMEIGEYELYAVELYSGDELYAEMLGDVYDFSKATIHVVEGSTSEYLDISLKSEYTDYALGSYPLLYIEHGVSDSGYLGVSGNILLDNLDLDTAGPDAFASFYYDEDLKGFIVVDILGLEEGKAVAHELMKAGRYTATGVVLGWGELNGTTPPDQVITGNKVLFTLRNPLEISPEELKDIPNSVEFAYSVLIEIDNATGEEKEALKEEYMEVIQRIITEDKYMSVSGTEGAPSYVFSRESLGALNIPEATDFSVTNIGVKLEATILSNEELVKYNEKLGEDKNIVGLFNLSLMKVIHRGDDVDTSKIENEDIKGMLTLRLPVPEEYKDSKNLKVVHITSEGVIEELESVIVKEGGINYLEFKTSHFSIYGLMEISGDVSEEPVEEEPVDEEPGDEEPVDEKPVEEETDKEETVEAGDKDKTEEKLPEAGAGSALGYSLSGVLFTGAGVLMLKKKKSIK